MEQFQITDVHPDQPVLMYTIVLPERYLDSTIYEEVKKYSSVFDFSIVIMNRKLWLNAAMSSEKLQDSLMGFMTQARDELMNILDCVMQISDSHSPELQAVTYVNQH